MKYFKLSIIALIAVIGVITSCSLGDDGEQTCRTSSYARITNVVSQDTIQVGVPATADVTFTISNNCGTFFNFAESATINPREVGVVINFDGCECNNVATTATRTYNFTPTTVGQFVIKYFVSQNNYITKVYTVIE